MDKWLWADALSMIWPLMVPLCATFFFPLGDGSHGWGWVDVDADHNVGEDDLALYVALVTALHV